MSHKDYAGYKGYENRGAVKKYLPHWQEVVAKYGKDYARRLLTTGGYKYINRKDALGLIIALGL